MKSKRMFRRNFLALAFSMAVASVALAAPGNARAADGPPNFILILTDDQSWVGPSAKEDPKLMRHITDQSISFMRKQAASQNPFFVQLSHYAVHLDIFYRQETLKKTKTWKPGRRHRMPEFAAMTYDIMEPASYIPGKTLDTALLHRPPPHFSTALSIIRLTMFGIGKRLWLAWFFAPFAPTWRTPSFTSPTRSRTTRSA